MCVHVSHSLIFNISSLLVPGRQSEKAGAKESRLALMSAGKREGKERVGAARGVCVRVYV